MSLAHQVVWQKCNVFVEGEDRPRTLSRGEMTPEGVDDHQLSMLGIIGAVAVVDSASAPEPPPVPDGPEPAPAVRAGVASARPARVAPKEQWVEFAVSEGVSRREAEGMSKEDLVKRFGG